MTLAHFASQLVFLAAGAVLTALAVREATGGMRGPDTGAHGHTTATPAPPSKTTTRSRSTT